MFTSITEFLLYATHTEISTSETQIQLIYETNEA